jgi:DNA-binding transcriptional ArsR family regulator
LPDEQRLQEALTTLRSTLAILSSVVDRQHQGPSDGSARPEVEDVLAVIRERRLRSRYFDAKLFADPAWDMLLDLFEADLSGARVSTTSLTAASGVPATTALRWIKRMTDSGLLERRPDGQRIFIELAPEAREAMRAYFERIGAKKGQSSGSA